MRALQAKWRRAAIGGVATCLLVVLGCDPVQEDRTIGFSGSGDHVAFQHGGGGIFVADPKTGDLRKIFDPDKSVLAVSTPLWSPDETQVIFTTARGVHSQPAAPAGAPAQAAAESPPEGRSFAARSIVYTCWLVQRSPEGVFGPATALFDARCDHAGYVAANLAVRWDPRQKAVCFVDREPNGGHAISSYQLATKSRHRLFPTVEQGAPRYVIADFTPDGSRVACVASGSGIWIGPVDGSNWRHVAESVFQPSDVSLNSVIARRPVWTRDGTAFAFVQPNLDEADALDGYLAKEIERARLADRPAIAAARSQLREQHRSKTRTVMFRGRIADRKVEQVFATTGQILDPHWSPDGAQIGFVTTEPEQTLTLIDAHNRVRQVTRDQFVRHFGGWNGAGDKLAYVAAEKSPFQASATWAYLLLPDPLARDAVWVVDVNGPSRVVASGLRFTFPEWSSKRDEISVWGTFTPSHQSPASEFTGIGIGLRFGDPAAIINVSTGGIRWLAIDGDEQAQIGHYFLQKRDYVRAREWYQMAEKQLPKLEPLGPVDLVQGLSGAAARRRTFEFFYWYCLTKLGESNKAAARLAAFDKTHRIQWPPTATPPFQKGPRPVASDPAMVVTSPAARREAERLVAILKALSMAQVFLSVDDVEGARAFFNRLIDAGDNLERLGSLLVLTQLHLLRNENREYADFVTTRLAPFLADLLDDRPADWTGPEVNDLISTRSAVLFLIGHAMAPLFLDGFWKEFSDEVVSSLVSKWEALRSRCHGETAELGIDLVLHAAAARLGHEKERTAAEARIRGNPAGARLLPRNGIEAYFSALRSLTAAPERPGSAGSVRARPVEAPPIEPQKGQ